MIQTIKNNKIVIILSLVLLIILGLGIFNYTIKQKEINTLKQELLKEQSKISDEQIIVNNIKINNKNIEKSTSIIKENEILLNKYEAQKKCWINQINRLMEGLEYNLNYCKLEENINKFQGLE